MLEVKKIQLNPDSNDLLDDVREFICFIRKDGVYRPNLLYHGFDGTRKNLALMALTGTEFTRRREGFCPDRQTFCSTEEQLFEMEDRGMNALSHAFGAVRPALAVYDGSQLDIVDGAFGLCEFKDPAKKLEALLIIYCIS
ncbi:MAG: hypothetical protein Q7R56_02870 [Nanoarchaeota archaeon]|nr:hypothetical protein [Nanoarchaeota archaeon]